MDYPLPLFRNNKLKYKEGSSLFLKLLMRAEAGGLILVFLSNCHNSPETRACPAGTPLFCLRKTEDCQSAWLWVQLAD